MPDTILQIAARIRDTREALGHSPAEVAAAVGISEGLYLSYEQGNLDIPIGFLTSFSEAYDIPLTSLLSGEEPKLSSYTHTKAGKGIHVKRTEGYEYMALAHRFIHKKAEVFHVTVTPDALQEIPLNAHVGQEFDYVLSGTLRFMIGEKEIIMEAGDSLYLDSAYMHGMAAMGDEPAEFLAVVMK